MVFCNTINSCRAIEHECREKGLDTICYHGEVPRKGRRNVIEEFSGNLFKLILISSSNNYNNYNNIIIR